MVSSGAGHGRPNVPGQHFPCWFSAATSRSRVWRRSTSNRASFQQGSARTGPGSAVPPARHKPPGVPRDQETCRGGNVPFRSKVERRNSSELDVVDRASASFQLLRAAAPSKYSQTQWVLLGTRWLAESSRPKPQRARAGVPCGAQHGPRWSTVKNGRQVARQAAPRVSRATVSGRLSSAIIRGEQPGPPARTCTGWPQALPRQRDPVGAGDVPRGSAGPWAIPARPANAPAAGPPAAADSCPARSSPRALR